MQPEGQCYTMDGAAACAVTHILALFVCSDHYGNPPIMELGLDFCQFRYFVDIIDTRPMTAPRIDLCMVGKARVAHSRTATKTYEFTVLPDRWTALQCNIGSK
jgi:hypothetical protein